MNERSAQTPHAAQRAPAPQATESGEHAGKANRPIAAPNAPQANVQPPTDARAVLDAHISEAAFQALVIGLARRTGWTAYHTHDSRHSEKGFPDLVLVGHGMILFRELKTERGKLSADQERWRDLLVGAGCDWRCWRPSDWPSVEICLTRKD